MTYFQLLQCIASLKLETRTGMRYSRGSVLKFCQSHGFQSRTKKAMLAELIAFKESLDAQ